VSVGQEPQVDDNNSHNAAVEAVTARYKQILESEEVKRNWVYDMIAQRD
jgi:hypothetical protein